MSLSQADLAEYYLRGVCGVADVKVFDRTADAVVFYSCKRSAVIAALSAFSFEKAENAELVPVNTSRALNREFEDRLCFFGYKTFRFKAVFAVCYSFCHCGFPLGEIHKGGSKIPACGKAVGVGA